MEMFKDKRFTRKLVSLILPITLQNFMFALVPVSDTIMLANLDQKAMEAVCPCLRRSTGVRVIRNR